ncbi:hypothetical protein M0R45_017742 [Rubus argutus]|uniref:RING-type E3 ubiquitin transferase n=1 Tax=Rubus argutus TaxID=59490 RepID=A0AAW1XYV7_RUBAR
MEVVVDHSCNLSLSDVIEPPDEELPCTQFLMDNNVMFRDQIGARDMEEVSYLYYSENEYGLKLDLWMHENTSRSVIARTLSRLNVPDQFCDFVVDKIVADALGTAKATRSHTNYMILHMAVNIFFYVVSMLDFVGMGEPVIEPASKSAIEELERARVEVSTTCSICLEDMMVGFEATRMPCSHLYHRGCIVKWLERSRFCPLCRFSMPIESLLSLMNIT